jgi:ParB-like chromosome segregation protein Spo0J
MNIEKIEISKLKPATYNPRQITTKQYNDLKKSIERFGLVDPIIVNEYFVENGYVVVGGHQRLKICKELKYTEIDCVVLNLSKKDERELNVRLNKNTGEFDMDILANEFDIDELTDWGFKHIDLDLNIDKIDEDTDDSSTITIKEDDLIKAQELYNDLKNKGYNVKIK